MRQAKPAIASAIDTKGNENNVNRLADHGSADKGPNERKLSAGGGLAWLLRGRLCEESLDGFGTFSPPAGSGP